MNAPKFGKTTHTRIQIAYEVIREFCSTHTNAEIAKKYSRTMTDGCNSYGIDQRTLDHQREFWLEEWRGDLTPAGYLRLCDLLIESGIFEEAYLGVTIAAGFRATFIRASLDRFGRWLDAGIRCRILTDVLCREILSFLVRNKTVPLNVFAPWRTAESKWKRRAAIELAVPLLKTEISPTRLLDFVYPLIDDREEFVRESSRKFFDRAADIIPKFSERTRKTHAHGVPSSASPELKSTTRRKAKRRRK